MKYPNEKMNPAWVHQKITPEVVEWCQSFAKFLAPNPEIKGDRKALTTSQLRKFFGEVRRIETDVVSNKASIAMLKPYLAYAVGRDRDKGRLRQFAEELSVAIAAIRMDDAFVKDDFSNFISIYEAIVAYHKYYGGN